MSDNKNLLVAIVTSLAILFGYNYFFAKPQTAVVETTNVPAVTALKPEQPQQNILSHDDGIKSSKRVTIQTEKLSGSIALKGALIDNLIINDYREAIDPQSKPVTLFSPKGTQDAYFVEAGFLSNEAIDLPNAQTNWTLIKGDTLGVNKPVVLQYQSPQGLVFERKISIDENYMFLVEDHVTNTSNKSHTLTSYQQINRFGTPQTSNNMILHEGILGVLNNKLQEVAYDKFEKTPKVETVSSGGWVGMTDKYWLAALVPADQKAQVKTSFARNHINNQNVYTTHVQNSTIELAPNATINHAFHVFAGAKQVDLLDAYEKKLGIPRFDLAIDFGWLYFITKPIFYALNMCQKMLGNMGLAILLLTVLMKVLLFPLAQKSYRSMARMRHLQPELQRLQQRYKDDRMRLNQEMMTLYKKEKVNPLAGCLPMLLQAPLFFALYKVLFVTIEMRHAPFFGWIHDLSAADPTNLFNLFGLIPWTPPALLTLGAWPLIMGASMFLQQKLNPQPTDPIQAKMFLIMPVMFTIFLAQFPAGLVIYWAWNNILSIAQQWFVMRENTTNKPHRGKIVRA